MTRDMVLNKNKIKRHKGYRILAIDGSELRLDKTRRTRIYFCTEIILLRIKQMLRSHFCMM